MELNLRGGSRHPSPKLESAKRCTLSCIAAALKSWINHTKQGMECGLISSVAGRNAGRSIVVETKFVTARKELAHATYAWRTEGKIKLRGWNC